MKPYYEQDGITIYHADCRAFDLRRLAESIVTDPPYGVGKKYGPSSVDNLETFKEAVCFIHESGLPAAVFVPVSRLMDLPARPEWFGCWTKTWGASALLAYPFYPHWEAIAFYRIKGDYKGNKGHRSDVFEYAPVKGDGSHPTMKPLSITSQVIELIGGNPIVDPFAGSGTTLVAAKNLGIQAVGIEIEERYCEVAARRLDQTVLDFGTVGAPPTEGRHAP